MVDSSGGDANKKTRPEKAGRKRKAVSDANKQLDGGLYGKWMVERSEDRVMSC